LYPDLDHRRLVKLTTIGHRAPLLVWARYTYSTRREDDLSSHGMGDRWMILAGLLGRHLTRGIVRDLRSDAEGELEQAQFLGACDCLDPSVDTQLGIDVPDVGAYRMDRKVELGSDLALRQGGPQQAQHL
jgi:hypothetical protein